jgi:predicted RNA-binding Zn-ribbon protein involved in translation (DUF1610 family)
MSTNPAKLHCPRCGAEMNHHGNKMVYEDGDTLFEGAVIELHSCPNCGSAASRPASVLGD